MRPKKAKRLKQPGGTNKSAQSLEAAVQHFVAKDYLGCSNLCRQIIATDPNNHKALHVMGCTMQQLGELSSALGYFEKAVTIFPNDPEYHINYAITLSLAKQNEEKAITHLKKAIALSPSNAKAYYQLGRLYSEQNRLADTRDAGEKAIRYDPDMVATYEMLALTYERLNDLEKMEQILSEGHKRFGDINELMLPNALLKRKRKQYDEALSILENLKSSNKRKNRQGTILSEMAKIYDAKKEFDLAYTHYEEAQIFVNEGYKEKGKVVSDRYRQVLKASRLITKDSVDSWQHMNLEDNAPSPLFLVGFPRSGTTLTEQVLASHPNLLASQEVGLMANMLRLMATIIGHETKYPAGLAEFTPEDIKKLRAYYREELEELFEEDTSGKQIVDKLPLNINYLGLIYRIFPKAKVLVLLRDPRDVCLSTFTQTFVNNSAMQHTNTLESTIGLYDETMSTYLHFRDILPKDMFLEVKYEDILDDLESNARKILEFYDQPWDDECLNYYSEDKNRNVMTPSYEGVMQPIYKTSAGKWLNYEKYFTPHLHKLAPYIEKFGY